MDVPPSEMLSDARFQEILRQMEKDKDFHQYSPMLFVLHFVNLADGLYVSIKQISEAAHKYDVRGAEWELNKNCGESGYLQQIYATSGFLYRMVGRGKDLYKAVYQQSGPPIEGPMVCFLEAGKPRTAHLKLEDVFATLQGELRICDPYYGTGSLLRLDLLTRCGPIRFLTQNPDNAERAQLPRALTEYTREHPAVEFRQHNGRDLHDRYILADTNLVLLGHGLKDVGNRESFVIRLPQGLVDDLMDDLRASFDAKWASALPLP